MDQKQQFPTREALAFTNWAHVTFINAISLRDPERDSEIKTFEHVQLIVEDEYEQVLQRTRDTTEGLEGPREIFQNTCKRAAELANNAPFSSTLEKLIAKEKIEIAQLIAEQEKKANEASQ